MDNKQQMIHMACEGILIGGLSLYFSKQLKQQAKEIEELKAIIAKNQAANEKRFEVVFNFLDNVNGGFMPQRTQHQEDRVVQLPEGPAPSLVNKQKVNAAVVAQKVPQKKVQTIEPKRLPQKKKVVPQVVEEPSVLTSITKKNAVKEVVEEKNDAVCDPNDDNCTDDIEAEMDTLLEGEELESDMDEEL